MILEKKRIPGEFEKRNKRNNEVVSGRGEHHTEKK